MPSITLPSKPSASIVYDLITPEGSGSTKPASLLVFINGLGLPAAVWKPTVSLLLSSSTLPSKPQILLYDRYGQGATTDRDPTDSLPGKDAAYGHDIQSCVSDLRELIQMLAPNHGPLIFVAASIGAHIARLYSSTYTNSVTGMTILDSNIGNKEYSDLWPNPLSPSFKPEDVVSEDCTLEQYLEAINKMEKMFNSDVKNGEGLDRRNVKILLPDPSEPKLPAPDGKGIWLTVVGHDLEAFAEEGFKILGVPRSLTIRFLNPPWTEYNEGLLKLTEPERRSGVLLAPGCGHFIQKDNPEFVANIVAELLRKVVSEN